MSDTALINQFMKVATECRKHGLGLSHDIENTLRQFEKCVAVASDPQKAWLKDVYGSELRRMRQTISTMPQLRSLQDKIFTRHLRYDKDAPSHVTELFREFIKGITYFAGEGTEGKPIYHRFFSCGPYEDTHRQGNLVCTENLSSKEIRRRKPLIERCYIERLIYNELWTHEMLFFPRTGVEQTQQNEGHMFRLDLTMRDYETCFPGTKLKVVIDYENNFPYKLVISKLINEKNVTKLTYIKTYTMTTYGNKIYSDLVECIKEENDKKYMKISTFANPYKSQIVNGKKE